MNQVETNHPNSEQPFSEEGYALMAVAFEVHREIRGGLAEEIYQESLEEELRLRGIPFVAKEELQVFTRARNFASVIFLICTLSAELWSN